MRNRKIQRELRRAGISKEEMLDLHDFCGIQDPTPYTAVKNIIQREEQATEINNLHMIRGGLTA